MADDHGSIDGMTSGLPPDIQAIIAWLVDMAKGYKGIVDGTPNLQAREVEGFKSDLMLRTWRWHRDRVPPSVFNGECIKAGLTPMDSAKLVDPLRRRQAGRRLVPRRERRGWTYDRVIDAADLSAEDDLAGEIGP